MKRWSLELQPHTGGLEVARMNPDETIEILASCTYEQVKQGERYDFAIPLVRGPDVRDFLQEAMDLGYRMGLRPSKGEDVAAVKQHLQDMRAIAFHTLKMPSQS